MIRATGVDSPDCIGTPTYRRHLRDESGIGRKKPLWWDLGREVERYMAIWLISREGKHLNGFLRANCSNSRSQQKRSWIMRA